MFFFQADWTLFSLLTMQYLISDSIPDMYHSFQLPAPQNLVFTVSMETGDKCQILKTPKNLWVHLIQSFKGPGCKILALYGQMGLQSPHFHFSMATVQNFKIQTPLRCSLTPTDCPCPISLRSVEKQQSSWRTEKTSETACLRPQQTPIIVWCV